jgi:hypothetical protein
MAHIHGELRKEQIHLGSDFVPLQNTLDGKGRSEGMETGAALMRRRGPKAQPSTELGKPGDERAMSDGLPSGGQEEGRRSRRRQQTSAQGAIGAKRGSGGGMQRHPARLREFALFTV